MTRRSVKAITAVAVAVGWLGGEQRGGIGCPAASSRSARPDDGRHREVSAHGSADGAVPVGLMNTAIRKAGLRPQDVRINDMAPVSSVISIQPAGGHKVKKHSTVIVVVSKGEPIPLVTATTVPTQVAVANVGNVTASDVTTDHEGAGFKVAIAYEDAAHVGAYMSDGNGHMMGQSPGGGAMAQPGTLVVVHIATGCPS